MNAPDPSAVRRGRRQLLLLAAIFFVPLAIAFWMYYGPTGWRPSGDASKGDLIDPARPLAALALTTAEANALVPVRRFVGSDRRPYYGVGPDFVREHLGGRFKDGTIVILMGCDTLRGRRLSEAFLSRGARTVIGWNDQVSAEHTDKATAALIGYLADRVPADDAVQRAIATVGADPETDVAVLRLPTAPPAFLARRGDQDALASARRAGGHDAPEQHPQTGALLDLPVPSARRTGLELGARPRAHPSALIAARLSLQLDGLRSARRHLLALLRPGDTLLTIGAGDVYRH